MRYPLRVAIKLANTERKFVKGSVDFRLRPSRDRLEERIFSSNPNNMDGTVILRLVKKRDTLKKGIQIRRISNVAKNQMLSWPRYKRVKAKSLEFF